jgi:hypothetical protein
LGDNDLHWLNSLSELQHETVLSDHMEMIRNEFLMRKALRQVSFSSEAVEMDCNVAAMDLIENATTLSTQPA